LRLFLHWRGRRARRSCRGGGPRRRGHLHARPYSSRRSRSRGSRPCWTRRRLFVVWTGVSRRRFARRADGLCLRRRRRDGHADRRRYSAPLTSRASVCARRVACERRRNTHHGPHGEHPANCTHQHWMLGQPSANPTIATASPRRAPAGIGPAPSWQLSAGPSGEHVIRMHHELLVRELVVGSIVQRSLVVLLAIRRDRHMDVGLQRPCLCGRDLNRRGLCFIGQCSICWDGSWRNVKRLRCPASETGLARPAGPRRPLWRIRLGHNRLRRGGRRGIRVQGWVRLGVLVHRCRSGCRDVQRHHPVARQVATRPRLLSDYLPEQLRLATKRALEAGFQPGTPNVLRGIRRRLADVLADLQAPGRATSTGTLSTPCWSCWRCGCAVHRGN